MTSIRLTPQYQLRWEDTSDTTSATSHRVQQEAFARDWRQGLFQLGAQKTEMVGAPTLRYWQELSKRYIARLCLAPADVARPQIEPLDELELTQLWLTAPPMNGGEYLSRDALAQIWEALDTWVGDAIEAAESLASFLQAEAPAWHQVGRVCFHLAENLKDAEKPFAFMATYTTGLSSTGQPKHLPLRNALEQYAGTHNRDGLRKLLTPVQAASARCQWVANMVENRQIYQPIAWTPQRAYQFLQSVHLLEESGLTVRIPNWWKKRARPRVSMTIDAGRKNKLGLLQMLQFDARIALGDDTISEEELAMLLNHPDGLVMLKGQWIELDREKLQAAIQQWKKLKISAPDGQISFIEGMRLLAGAPIDLKGGREGEIEHTWFDIEAGTHLRQLLAELRDPNQLQGPDPGDALKATLRPYQQKGLAWLHLLSGLGLGACLADDMGLGKTLQTIALLLCTKAQAQTQKETLPPSLLVLPASLLGNWKAEIERFAPDLTFTFLHTAMNQRQTLDEIAAAPAKQLKGRDLVITTYGMLQRQKWIAKRPWHLVILDEAQAIKNPQTNQTKATKQLRSHARIALTGTPVENRLGDLWSLFDFLNPGLLGTSSLFKSFIQQLENRQRDQFAPLRQLVNPYILRRMKTDRSIIADLPDKTEIIRYCQLSKPQITQYENVLQEMREALANADGIGRKGLVLTSLMRLKQVCNHPSQLSGDFDYHPDHSGKFQQLAEICTEIAERQEKVLIFTQFREIIEPLEAHLTKVFGHSGLQLHGGTQVKKRKAAVEAFQDPDGPAFFLLSLKAGGTGLNLTAASHVIHFDRWWNPAVENQATDRAFRIGQKRNVLVHKFVTSGTIEERIDDIIRDKQALSDQLLDNNGEVNLTELSDDALLELVSLDINRAAL